MAIKMRFDTSNNIIQPTFALAKRNGTILGFLPVSNLHISDNFNSSFEISFTVSKYDNNVEYPLWDEIKDFKLIYCHEWDVWFEIYVEVEEENSIFKNVTGVSICEAELSQIKLFGIEINTENDISREDYKPTTLFNEEDAEASMLDRMMEKIPHYRIGHVDSSIANIQRTFSFDDISIYDAFQRISEEIDCLFVFSSGMDEDNKIARIISVYDLESCCLDCGKRGDFIDKCSYCESTNIRTGYGEDTNIFVSTDNLADGITYFTDTDSVKNCFRLEAGDDLMTATIANCNPNGSGYIWHISEETKEDMSTELSTKINEYDMLYEYYQKQYTLTLDSDLVSAYNELIEKYLQKKDDLSELSETLVGYPSLMQAYYDTIDFYVYLKDELLPSVELSPTNAEEQAMNLTTVNLSPVAVNNLSTCSTASATSAVLAMAKTLVYADYQIKISDGNLDGNYWSGVFKVTNYSDEEDTYTTGAITVTITDNNEKYIRQQIEKAVNNKSGEVRDIKDLFALDLDNFVIELRKYCLSSLSLYADACQACLDILIQHGVADDTHFLYEDVYLNYYNKLTALQQEIQLREHEIAIIAGKYDRYGELIEEGVQTSISEKNREIQDALNFESFIGSELWKEFCAYRREDTYSNSNYISDGLNNRELFNNALQFIDVAQKDIVKSSTLQHSISASLKNLLVMKEFQPIVNYFKVGNWIHVMVDDNVYRLRLISYEVDFDSLESIDIEFSDVQKTATGVSDSESLMNQVSEMATSYDSVKRQSEQGNDVKKTLTGWTYDGLSLTKLKIIDNAQSQNITWDEHGILCREYLPIIDSYSDKQLKIINRGLYLTDDNWLTSRAGIGDFMYYDPETGEMVEAYGVIADTLVGHLILSEKTAIHDMGNSIVMDRHGIVVTTNNPDGEGETASFTIRKKIVDEEDNVTYDNVVYIDDEGNAHFKGELNAATGNFTGSVYSTDLFLMGEKVYFAANSERFGFFINDYDEDTEDEATLYFDNNGNAYFKGSLDAADGNFLGSVYSTDLFLMGDGIYFAADSSTFGFYLVSNEEGVEDSPLLYFENGNLAMTGTIIANNGFIGGENGWVIGDECLYSGSASHLSSAGGIYIGTDGISLSSAITLQPHGTMFMVRSDNQAETNDFAMKIVENVLDDDSYTYTLYFGGSLEFDPTFVLPVNHGGTGGVDRDSASPNFGIRRVMAQSQLSSLSGDNGDLCILYSNGNSGSEIVGHYTTSTSTQPGYLAIASYQAAGHKLGSSYFGISNYYWNISSLSGENVDYSYARVGAGSDNSAACALYVPINITVTNGSSGNNFLNIQFNLNLKPNGASRLLTYSTSNAITIALAKNGSIIGSTSYTLPSGWQSVTNASRTATATIRCGQMLTSGEYYVIFYSKTTNTLMWVVPSSISSPRTSAGAASGLYIMSGGSWQSVIPIV